MVDIPDTWIVFGSAVRCETVMGYKVDNSKRSEANSHVRIPCGNWCNGSMSVHIPLRKYAVNGLRR